MEYEDAVEQIRQAFPEVEPKFLVAPSVALYVALSQRVRNEANAYDDGPQVLYDYGILKKSTPISIYRSLRHARPKMKVDLLDGDTLASHVLCWAIASSLPEETAEWKPFRGTRQRAIEDYSQFLKVEPTGHLRAVVDKVLALTQFESALEPLRALELPSDIELLAKEFELTEEDIRKAMKPSARVKRSEVDAVARLLEDREKPPKDELVKRRHEWRERIKQLVNK